MMAISGVSSLTLPRLEMIRRGAEADGNPTHLRSPYFSLRREQNPLSQRLAPKIQIVSDEETSRVVDRYA